MVVASVALSSLVLDHSVTGRVVTILAAGLLVATAVTRLLKGRRTEADLLRSLMDESRSQSILLNDIENHVDTVFWTCTPDFQHLLHVSKAFERMWQMPMSALIGDDSAWQRRVHVDDVGPLHDAMRIAIRDGIYMQSSFRLVMPDATIKWVRVDAYPVTDAHGRVERYVSVCVDVTEERRRLTQLDYLAHVDSLTHLANRKSMMDALSKACGETAAFALLFIDVDRFKLLNDTVGHMAADRLLRIIGRRIRKVLPEASVVARPGGDEFTAILPGLWSEDELGRICGRLTKVVEYPIKSGQQGLELSLSVGIALFPDHGHTREALLTSADTAMYAAKRAGRNTWRIFGAAEKNDLTRNRLEQELGSAFRNGQFSLHYQPQICLRTRKVIGVEALLRWNHPVRGFVSPAEFVPLLEHAGLILPVGDWVVAQATEALSELHRLGYPLSMSINVSAVQFRDTSIQDAIATNLRFHGLRGESLVVEITESILMDRSEAVQHALNAIRDMQVGIALDDFGTGFSSLSYLAKFRPEALKLDKSFVDDIEDDAVALTIVQGVIDLAHRLGVHVLAEGVEREGQLQLLEEAGCDSIQGYLVGRPVPFADLIVQLALEPATSASAGEHHSRA
ncbi:putative bifunctional diguanylate cyclase/phosphodiesterase [Pararobbsia alpina]|uniref:putative bifunctional diguanylate cyclase/phosphodiesterase n=1 Tax=Pararobbsia alpina TaxID=621374 RepID=UPI0039A4AE9B